MQRRAAPSVWPRAEGRELKASCASVLPLHNRVRSEFLQVCLRLHQIELRIQRLKAQEKFVRRRTVAEIRRVKQRMVKRRQAVQRQHSERSRETGPENGPLVRRNNKSRPGIH